MRIELTRVGLLFYLANHYTTLGALNRGTYGPWGSFKNFGGPHQQNNKFGTNDSILVS